MSDTKKVVTPDLRAEIIKPSASSIVRKQAAAASRQVDIEDMGWQGVEGIIEPIYNPTDLAGVPDNSNILPQLITAMMVNVDSFGHTFQLRDPKLETLSDSADEIEKERRMLMQFFGYVSYPISFAKLRMKMRADLHAIGTAYWEMIDIIDGKLTGITHLPSHTMRLTKKETKPIMYDAPLVLIDDDGLPYIKYQKMYRRFRKYIQLTESQEKVWFKEWGDPRSMDWRTGEYKEGISQAEQATSILQFSNYSARSPYGAPVWIGNIFSMIGSRSAEEINYNTFSSNMIPALALLVAGGKITQGSIDRIREYLEDVVAGASNYSQVLLIEAEAQGEEMLHNQGTVRVDLKPLTDAQRTDEMFVNYDKHNRAKLRESFRINSILLGDDEGYNRATAQVARRLGDEQVFAPERADFDFIITNLILPYLGAKYHKYVSRRPSITDPDVITRAITSTEKGGGMNPSIARDILEELLGRDLPPINAEKIDPDTPMSIQIAERAQKKEPEGAQGAIKTPSAKRIDTDDMIVLSEIKGLRESINTALDDIEAQEDKTCQSPKK